jgi:lysophospholipase L1-like esterase
MPVSALRALRLPALRVLGPSAAAAGVAAVAAWQAWLLRQAWKRADDLIGGCRPFEVDVADCRARVLLVGDSTGVGVGVQRPEQSLAGLLAARLPRTSVTNRCVSGARVADVCSQVEGIARAGRHYDLVLVLAGGNDLIRMTPHAQLRVDARRLARSLTRVGREVVWIGCGLARSPRLLPPLSWWAAARSRATVRLLAAEAVAAGIDFIDLTAPAHDRVFALRPAFFFAADGVHPSAGGYLYCFEELLRVRPTLAADLGVH